MKRVIKSQFAQDTPIYTCLGVKQKHPPPFTQKCPRLDYKWYVTLSLKAKVL